MTPKKQTYDDAWLMLERWIETVIIGNVFIVTTSARVEESLG